MDYKERYMHALEKIREGLQPLPDGAKISGVTRAFLEEVFPELKESEDERIRKGLIKALGTIGKRNWGGIDVFESIAWLEKQGKQIVDCPQNHQDMNHPNGGIVMEDFNGGEGFYKLNLDYLNKKQVEEIEGIVKTWNTKSNDDIIKECVGMALTDVPQSRFESYGTSLKECLAWLEKQKSVGEIVERCKNSWYNEGKIAGMAEGLTDDEKYQQGWHDALEKQGKKPTWSENDERIITALMEGFRYHQLFNPTFGEVPNAEIISWIKSLKERLS